jgi:hypothetical protein
MNRTTTKLRLTLADLWMIHETRIRDTVSIACIIGILLFVRPLLVPQATSAPVVMHEAQQPAILVMTATPAPTPLPQPTATPVVIIQEVYIAAPTQPPIVEYIEVPVYIASEPAQEAPAPADVPTLAPQQLVIWDRQAWAQQAAGR